MHPHKLSMHQLLNASGIIFIVLLFMFFRYGYNSTSQKDKIIEKNSKFIPEKSIIKEAIIILKTSLQMALSLIFEVCVHTVSAIFLGHLSNSNMILSVTSIATSFMYMTGISLSWGFCTALWTLIPQAVGSNQIHLIALYIQRAIVVCFVMEIPLSFVLFYSGNILSYLGIANDDDVPSYMISNYCRILIPYPYLMVVLSCLHRVGQNLNYNLELLMIQGFTFILSIPLNYIFVTGFNFGYLGAALAQSLTILSSVIITAIFLIGKGYGFIFKPLPIAQVCNKQGLYQYLQLAWPSGVQIALSWITRDSIITISGYVPSANQALTVSCTATMFQLNQIRLIYNGFTNGSTVRIGKYIGARSIYHAKRCIKIQMFYVMSLFVIIATVYIMNKNILAKIFTNDRDVISLTSELMYILLFNQITFAIYRNISGVYRALGYQKLSAYAICVTQYLIAFPLQLYLLSVIYVGDYEMGIYIIWIGRGFGYLLADLLIICILLFCTDWNKAVQESEMRMKSANVGWKAAEDAMNTDYHKYKQMNEV